MGNSGLWPVQDYLVTCSQQFGIDYNETFAPVMKYKSLRIILAIVAIKDYELKQLDVKSAFLNADIKEEVYMKQPEGFQTGGANTVCKLQKTLYGTKQAPMEWNNVINDFIISTGFKRCKSDVCLYTKMSKSGKVMLIGILLVILFLRLVLKI